MKVIRLLAVAVLAAAVSVGFAHADAKKLTQDEVKALTTKAAGLVAAQGIDAAAKVFNADGEFKFGEVYVNVIDMNGVWLCYPPKPEGVGKSVLNVKDADGKFLVQDIIKVAKEKGEGWVEYRWMNPATHQIQPKLTYLHRVPGKDMIAYIGIYK